MQSAELPPEEMIVMADLTRKRHYYQSPNRFCDAGLGATLQAGGGRLALEHTARSVIIVGVGFVYISAAGMVGIEAYCFVCKPGCSP